LTPGTAHPSQGALVKRTRGDGSWTVYIGGIYEKRFNGTYVKYYSALGRRIAMRDNAGVVNYILADHLGSSTTITDASGGDLRTMNYYPYGAERSSSGGMITDKLFTGQQKEPQAVSALGLYNYGARFYSTLTGRFLSPDPLVASPGDPQVLNRYSYVRNNPLMYVDPAGLIHMAVICGWGQKCESGEDIGDYRSWVIWYWMKFEHLNSHQAADKWDRLVRAAKGADPVDILRKYHVLFIDTETSDPPSGPEAVFVIDERLEELRENMPTYVAHAEEMLQLRQWDVILAFSLGGAVLTHVMANHSLDFDFIRAVIFVEAAIDELGRPSAVYGYDRTRFLVVHETGKLAHMIDIAHGALAGTVQINSGECGGMLQHCTLQESAKLAMSLAYSLPPGAYFWYDRELVRYMRALGADMCVNTGGQSTDVSC
jgi:RHS repeat-associated protein